MGNNNLLSKVLSKSGDITLKYRNIYLHSKYSPKKEAERFVNENYNLASIQILLGYGAGYIYEELKRKLKEYERIIVIDPLIKDLPNKDFVYLEKYDIQSIKNFLQKNLHITDSVNMIISINYDKIINENEEFQIFLKVLREKMNSNQISENTITYFSSQWNENYLRNLKYSFQDHSIRELFSEEDFPIVVAAGGPSLTKQLSLIKKYRNKIVLIAAGTTINSLLKFNIRPDLVVSVDGGEVNFNHFKNLNIEDFPLVYCPTLHYGIRKNFKNAYYCFLTMEETLIPHYRKYAKKSVETLIGGSSVANTAYNLALFLSSGPVALIGQDLAYTNGESHAEGNLNRKSITSEDGLFYEGYNDDVVKTNQVFLQMKEGFELIQSEMSSQDRTYNCTEGGIKIQTIQQLPFEEFLNKFTKENLNKDYSYALNDKKDIFYFRKLLADETRHNNLIKLFTEAIKEIENNSSDIKFDLEILKKLDKIDNKIKIELKASSLNYAFNVVNLHTLKYFKVKNNASNIEKYKASYNQSKYMYEEMLKVTQKSLKVIQELIQEVENDEFNN